MCIHIIKVDGKGLGCRGLRVKEVQNWIFINIFLILMISMSEYYFLRLIGNYNYINNMISGLESLPW